MMFHGQLSGVPMPQARRRAIDLGDGVWMGRLQAMDGRTITNRGESRVSGGQIAEGRVFGR